MKSPGRSRYWSAKFVFGLAFIFSTNSVVGQELIPELRFGARGVVSGNINLADKETASAVSDFSDSSVLFGARQQLFGSYRAQLVVGFQFPDAESQLGQVFYHHLFVRLDNRLNVFQIGRSRLDSNLMEFPTLRDDDALSYTDAQSPFSDGRNSEDTQFGNLVQFGRYLTPRIRLDIHGEYYSETRREEESYELNTAGFTIGYRVPESQRWNRHLLDQLVFGVEGFFSKDDPDAELVDEVLNNVKLGVAINLRPDPVHFWRLVHQTIVSFGADDVRTIDSYLDTTRARALASFTSVEYVRRRLERPDFRVSIGGGFRIFPELDTDSGQFLIFGNFFRRLGANFDAGVQGVFESSYGDLSGYLPKSSFRINLALVYSIEHVFNNQFDDRNSILNLEHGYIN